MNTNKLSFILLLMASPSVLLAARPSITGLQVEINQLKEQVNQLASDLQNTPKAVVLKDANNNYIGRTDFGGGQALTNEGFIVSLSKETGEIGNVSNIVHTTGGDAYFFFESDNCTGSVFHPSTFNQYTAGIGYVFKMYSADERYTYATQNGELPTVISNYYIPKDFQFQQTTRAFYSSVHSSIPLVCNTLAEPYSLVITDMPPINDPLVTGVSNTAYPSPLRVE